MASKKKKSGLSDYERDRLARLKQPSTMRPYSPGLPQLMEDPAGSGKQIPEDVALYPLEEGGEATGVGSDGTTPYSPEYYKKKEKRPPGKIMREEWEEAEQPEEAIPVTKEGKVKSLLQKLRRPGSSSL